MIRGFLPRLTSFANAVSRFVQETQIARLAIMALKLWPRVQLLSALLVLLALGCIALASWSAHTLFTTLEPAAPLGAWIVAGLAAVVVLELCAYTAVAGIEALLQLAYDFGRHRVGVLLALATVLAGVMAMQAVPGATELTIGGWAALATTAVLLAITGWFQRTYRRPARGGFRDFHVDVVDARHFLARAGHGA